MYDMTGELFGDPEFYTFVRTLEAYEKSLKKDTTVILPSDSEFFQYLAPASKNE